jgi:hypothetical protein
MAFISGYVLVQPASDTETPAVADGVFWRPYLFESALLDLNAYGLLDNSVACERLIAKYRDLMDDTRVEILADGFPIEEVHIYSLRDR